MNDWCPRCGECIVDVCDECYPPDQYHVESSALPPCKNSSNGEHKLADKIGKNAGKPDHCVLCTQLLSDLKRYAIESVEEEG